MVEFTLIRQEVVYFADYYCVVVAMAPSGVEDPQSAVRATARDSSHDQMPGHNKIERK